MHRGFRIGLALISTALTAAPALAAPPAATSGAPTGIERLEAIEDIKNLRLTFCRALDDKDWDKLRTTMADDFSLYFGDESGPGGAEVRPPIKTASADAFIAFAKPFMGATEKMFHICTMPQIEFQSRDKAR